MDAKSLAELAGATAELRQILDGVKSEYGATNKSLSDFSERLTQTKAEMVTKAEVAALLARVNDIAARDSNRGTMVPQLDYNMRSMREVMEESQPTQARELFGLFLTSQPVNENVREYHRLSAKIALLQTIMRKVDRAWTPERASSLRTKLLWRQYLTLGRDLLGDGALARAFDSAEVSEWVPTILSAELARYIEIYGALIPNLVNFDMPSGLYERPITTGYAEARLFTETTTLPSGGFNYAGGGHLYADGSAPAGKIQYDAEKLRAFLVLTGDLQEESIVPMLDWGLGEVGAATRRALEKACQNGGTANAEPDADNLAAAATDGSKDARQAWDGMRRRIKVNATTYNAGTTEGNRFTVFGLIQTLALMKQYAIPGPVPNGPPPVIGIASFKGYIDLIDTPEFLTADKRGPAASNTTGAVGETMGIPWVISQYARQDVTTTGFQTAGGQTLTSFVLFHRGSWTLGTFRGLYTEQERLAGFDQNVVYAWWKGDFQKIQAAAEPTEAAMVNIS